MDNAQIAYEYIRQAYDDIFRLRLEDSNRLHKLLIVIVILFSALSYGLGELPATPGTLPAYAEIAQWLGLIAAVLLGVAFVCTLWLLRLSLIAVPPVAKLDEKVLKSDFRNRDEGKLWAVLAKNVAEAYDHILTTNVARRRVSSRLNFALIAGCISTALFLASAILLRYNLVEDHSPAVQAKEPSEMPDAKPDGQDSPPSPEPTTPSASQPASEPSPGEADSTALDSEDLLESPNLFQGSFDHGERFRKKS